MQYARDGRRRRLPLPMHPVWSLPVLPASPYRLPLLARLGLLALPHYLPIGPGPGRVRFYPLHGVESLADLLSPKTIFLAIPQ